MLLRQPRYYISVYITSFQKTMAEGKTEKSEKSSVKISITLKPCAIFIDNKGS